MKVLEINQKVWKGSVILFDPLTMPQVRAIEEALESTSSKNIEKLSRKDGEKATVKKYIIDERMLPAICACVKEWRIENFPEIVTPETFPMSPINESHNLIKTLFNEITKIYLGEIEVPNV